MSTEYGYKCRECSVSLVTIRNDLAWVCRALLYRRRIEHIMEDVLALQHADVLRETLPDWYTANEQHINDDGEDIFLFLLIHRDHTLIIIDEYGFEHNDEYDV